VEISKEEIEAVKRSHDLKEVIASYGVALKRKGSNYVGLCPFHEEKDPSLTVNPKTNLYHCFGCNAGGDVIGFVARREGIGFREAVLRLAQQVRWTIGDVGDILTFKSLPCPCHTLPCPAKKNRGVSP